MTIKWSIGAIFLILYHIKLTNAIVTTEHTRSIPAMKLQPSVFVPKAAFDAVAGFVSFSWCWLMWKLDNVISLSLMLFIVLECYISIGVQLWVATTGLLSLADEEEASEKKYDSRCSERCLKGSFSIHLHRGDMGQNTSFCEGLLEIRW